jgi:tRNA-Thr(GGU) m(6)t(6)A37 methyltransferase TsaA
MGAGIRASAREAAGEPGAHRGAAIYCRKRRSLRSAAAAALLSLMAPMAAATDDTSPDAGAEAPVFEVRPIGWVRRDGGRTTIEIEPAYREALLGVDELEAIWVLFWFDRNDDSARRSILRVHPRANPANPLRGVFATRAPVRPNLIGLTRVRILSVDGLSIEIDDIDAWDDTPVLDLKP